MRFSDLVAPLDPQTFLRDFWTRKAVHLRRGDRTFEPHFGWGALNAILNAGDLTFPQVKVSRNDGPVPTTEFTTGDGARPPVDPRAVVSLFEGGASFGITGADSHWPPLRSIVDAIYDALAESVHANVYCSPANTQGFQCHFDLHEVFVLQVEGAKHWRVFRQTTDAPIDGWRPEDAPNASTDPYVDTIVERGDVLYVPRGHWHYAVAQDSMSLHVTVGVTCRKGTAFLDWLAGGLSSEPVWRRNIPIPLTGGAHDGRLTPPEAFSKWSDELRRSLTEKLSEPDLFERFYTDTFGAMRPAHAIELPIQAATGSMRIDEYVFERPPGRRHVIADHGAMVSVSTAGCELQLEGLSGALISRIFDSNAFTAAEVREWQPDVNLDEVSELLRELVRSGLLLARPRRSTH